MIFLVGSSSAKQCAAQGTRSPAPKVHTGTLLSSGVKVSLGNLTKTTFQLFLLSTVL